MHNTKKPSTIHNNMTNGDRIRSMDNGELAQFLSGFNIDKDVVPGYCKGACPFQDKCSDGRDCVDSSKNNIIWWLNTVETPHEGPSSS